MAIRFGAGLDRLSARLGKLTTVPKLVATTVEKVIDDDLARTYAAESDPYGRRWKKRKVEPKDGHPILDDTGQLKSSRSVKVKADGELEVSYDDWKAPFHQPTRALSSRTRARGLPKRWKDAIKQAFTKSLRSIMNG